MKAATAQAGPAGADPADAHQRYVLLLGWAFTFFNAVRMLAYLPTSWAIVRSGDASQHSLWTWGCWMLANATMAAWLHEHNGRRMDKAVAVNIGNATMCLLTALVILAHRV